MIGSLHKSLKTQQKQDSPTTEKSIFQLLDEIEQLDKEMEKMLKEGTDYKGSSFFGTKHNGGN